MMRCRLDLGTILSQGLGGHVGPSLSRISYGLTRVDQRRYLSNQAIRRANGGYVVGEYESEYRDLLSRGRGP
jgi:hypothetical protein